MEYAKQTPTIAGIAGMADTSRQVHDPPNVATRVVVKIYPAARADDRCIDACGARAEDR
jgi:hypothetical protein